MLTGIRVYSSRAATLDLPLGYSPLGIIVAKIDGLDPVKATFTTSSLANTPGVHYRSGVREARNVVIALAFNMNQLPTGTSDLRRMLYSYFTTGLEVEIAVITDQGELGRLVGRTETFEFDIFSRTPTATISILCFNPDIRAEETTESTYTTDASIVREFYNPGDVPSGFELEGVITAATNSVTINLNDEILEFTQSLAAGDILNISTIPGEKGATKNRAGVVTSALAGVTATSKWPQVLGGDNSLRVSTGSGSFSYKFSYNARYGGV